MSTIAAPKPLLSRSADYGPAMTRLGTNVVKYGLALVLLWIGFLKFQPFEAMAVMPLIAHSPFMAWMLSAFGLQPTADIIGAYEITAAILIVLGSVNARLGMAGGFMAVLTFIGTLSFIFTTPAGAVYAMNFSFPFFSMVGQFLIKDVVLLGAAILVAGNAWAASSASEGTAR